MTDFLTGMKIIGDAVSAVISAEVTERTAEERANRLIIENKKRRHIWGRFCNISSVLCPIVIWAQQSNLIIFK